MSKPSTPSKPAPSPIKPAKPKNSSRPAMTLREEYAGIIFGNMLLSNYEGTPYDLLAEEAVKAADSLLEALATLPHSPVKTPVGNSIDNSEGATKIREQQQWGTAASRPEDDFDDSDPFADEIPGGCIGHWPKGMTLEEVEKLTKGSLAKTGEDFEDFDDSDPFADELPDAYQRQTLNEL